MKALAISIALGFLATWPPHGEAKMVARPDVLHAFETEYLNENSVEDTYTVNLISLADQQRILEAKGFASLKTDFFMDETPEHDGQCPDGPCKVYPFRFVKKMSSDSETLFLIGEGSLSVYPKEPVFREFKLLWEGISRDDSVLTPPQIQEAEEVEE